MTVLVLVLSILASIILINYLQSKHIESLPNRLKSWDFLPLYSRSLKPYDNLIVKYLCFSKIFNKTTNIQKVHSAIKSNDASENKNDSDVVVFINNAYQTESF